MATTGASLWRGPLPALLLMAGALYGAFGTESPFLPSFLAERGLRPDEIGMVLAAGTVVRLVAGPLAGYLADRLGIPGRVLGLSAALAGGLSLLYLAGIGFWPLLGASMLHAIAVAPLAPLADAIALAAARRTGTFEYGWIRGAGSGAFILGILVSGQLVAGFGLVSIVLASAVLFGLLALATTRLPVVPARPSHALPADGLRALLGIPVFVRVLAVAALVIGSHALNDGFAVILWRAAGISPQTTSLLWAESVAAEIVVFVLVGPRLLARLGPARAAGLAALAGLARWSVMALTVSVPVLAVSQLAHGLTFALLHLANMQIIGTVVPERLAATAQTLYGTLGLGLASVLLTLASGALFAQIGAGAFWVMAALCAVGLPLALTLNTDPRPAGSGTAEGAPAAEP